MTTYKPIEQSNIKGVSMLGFRINPDSPAPEFYTFFTYGDVDRALKSDDYLVFFIRMEQKKQAFELFDGEIKERFSVPDEIDLTVDLAMALYLIENENFDDSAVILNCLNTVFDLLLTANKPLSDERKRILWSFADHLTFENEFSKYLIDNSVDRETIIDALTWCVGAIFVKSRILSE